MIKMLFSDLDGTLTETVNGKTVISDESLKGLKLLKNSNVRFCIASGRNDSHTTKTAEMIDWTDCDIISCNGASIKVDGKKTVFNIEYDNFCRLAEYFYSISDGKSLRMIGSRNDGVYVSDWFDDYFINKYTGRYEICRDYTIRDLIDKPEIYPGFQKMQISVYTKDKEFWYNDFREKFSDIMDIGSPNAIQNEFMKYGCNKGTAIDFIRNHYSLREDEIAVIGDADNDIAMLQKAKYSFVVETGEEKAKEKAFMVVKDFAECCQIIIERNKKGL